MAFYDSSFPALPDLDTHQFFNDSPLAGVPVPALLETPPFMLSDPTVHPIPTSPNSDESGSITSQEDRFAASSKLHKVSLHHSASSNSLSSLGTSDMDVSDGEIPRPTNNSDSYVSEEFHMIPGQQQQLACADAAAVKMESRDGGGLAFAPPQLQIGNTRCSSMKQDSEDNECTKKQRLARKAELARLSRKRKKMRMTVLEDQVRNLQVALEKERKLREAAETQAMETKTHLEAVTQGFEGRLPTATEARQAELKQLHARLQHHMKEYMAVSAPTPAMSRQFETHNALLVADIVRVCQAMLASPPQFGFLSHAVPLPLAFLEWVMSQSDSFYTDPAGLWMSLFQKEVGLSEDQMVQLLQLRDAMRISRTPTFSLFMDYATIMKNHLVSAAKHMDGLVSIFSPSQLARFLAWVDTYGSVCINITP